ncbi:MAG: translation initiation factor [Oceanipulchritudo sp.]
MARQGKKDRIGTGGGDPLTQENPFASLSGEGLKRNPEKKATEAGGPSPEKAGKRRETLLLRRLKSGRGGKVVTEVSGFKQNPADLEALLKRLQTRLGSGGTRRGAVLELQGERRAELREQLETEGYRVKGI